MSTMTDADIREFRAAITTSAAVFDDSVGLAWLEAESFLPDGWQMRGVWRGWDVWRAEAAPTTNGYVSGSGDSAAAALRALADELRKRAEFAREDAS